MSVGEVGGGGGYVQRNEKARRGHARILRWVFALTVGFMVSLC